MQKSKQCLVNLGGHSSDTVRIDTQIHDVKSSLNQGRLTKEGLRGSTLAIIGHRYFATIALGMYMYNVVVLSH